MMWIGEQITERGIGNGISLIIMAGIVARLPSAMGTTVQFVREGEMSMFVLLLVLAVAFGVTAGIVYVETAQRRIPVQYAQAGGGPAGLWRADLASAAQDQYCRGDTTDFCLFDSGFPGDAGDVRTGAEKLLSDADAGQFDL